jgi:murein DD-endopeptidase MepM/ murein hydrolase activator NlpD
VTNPAEGLSFSGAVAAQAQPDTLRLTVNTESRTVVASSAAANSPPGSATADRAGETQVAALAASNSPPDDPECDATQSDLYCVYTIQEGDTLSTIAEKFGLKNTEDLAAWELLVYSNKPDIASEDDLLQVGQKLRIPTGNAPIADPVPRAASEGAADAEKPPSRNGIIHTVLRNETLSDIAENYGVAVDDIVRVNFLEDPDDLQIGDELLIPNPTRVFTPPPPPPAARGGSGQPAGGPRSASGLIWPVTGSISSYFGPGHPLGIDIDLYSNPNAPIGAAMAGTVTFAGGNACCSYGLYVVIDHGNGYQTLYAHLSRVAVRVGQRVSQGELIGYGGRTGYATGNHLHFEVHLNGVTVNPLAYLP